MDKTRRLEPEASATTCPNCSQSEIATTLEEQTFLYGKEGTRLTALVPVRTCKRCGFQFTDYEAEEARDRAVREHLDAPSPAEIEQVRGRYDMSRSEFGAITGIGSASLARWESGNLIPNTANIRYLYLLTFPENIERLKNRRRAPEAERQEPARPCRSTAFREIRNIEIAMDHSQRWQLRRGRGA